MRSSMRNLAAALLLSSTVLWGVSAHAAVGVRGGYGFSAPTFKIAGAEALGLSREGGLLGGLAIEAGLGPVGVVADVLYAKRVLGTAGATQTFTYVEIPVMAKVDLAMFRLMGGGYYAFSLGQVESCANGNCVSNDYGTNLGVTGGPVVSYRKGDMGLMAGLGFSLPVPGLTVALDLRYRMGLRSVGSTEIVDFKWRGFDVVAGVLF